MIAATKFEAYRSSASVLMWSWPGVTLSFPPARPYIAGILNITPDSFSDGGRFLTVEKAVGHALAMAEAGAAIIDTGGQSTRPGSLPVSPEEEAARVLPVLAALKEALGHRHAGKTALLSLDTDKPALAERVLSLGLADMINDESGGDKDMALLAVRYNVPLILMHRPDSNDRGSLGSVLEDLAGLRRSYTDAGVPPTHIALDPGIGFGKDDEENLAILRNCAILTELGSPLYIGASRKRFIGKYSGNPDADSRLGGSLAAALWAAANGAAFLRVHDVKETAEALAIQSAFKKAEIRTENNRERAKDE